MILSNINWDQPGGAAVKFTFHALCFGSLGFAGSDPGHGPIHHSSSPAVAASHTQNRGSLAQMLAQQQKRKIGNRCWHSLPHQEKQKQKQTKNVKLNLSLFSSKFAVSFCLTLTKAKVAATPAPTTHHWIDLSAALHSPLHFSLARSLLFLKHNAPS